MREFAGNKEYYEKKMRMTKRDTKTYSKLVVDMIKDLSYESVKEILDNISKEGKK